MDESTNPNRSNSSSNPEERTQARTQVRPHIQAQPSIGKRILSFLKMSFAAAFGVFIFFLVMGGLLLANLLITAITSGGGEVAEVKPNSILKVDLAQPISEYVEDDPFAKLFASLDGSQVPLSLVKIKAAFKKAKTDDNIRGVYLDITDVPVGFAMLEEIHDAIEDFKTSGKFIYAYSKFYGEKGYYIATLADEIYLYPQGGLEMNGFFTQIPFFKKMLDKLEIEPRVYKVGTFKSAVEPFLLEEMSEANREQTSVYLNSLQKIYLEKVAAGRNIPLEKLKDINKNMLVREAGDAIKYGLVNDTIYYDQLEEKLYEKLAIEKDDEGKYKEKLSFISLGKYLSTVSKEKEGNSDKRIAIIVGEGSIVDGKGGQGQIGGDRIAKAIRKARKDDKVKAVVLRINSGGGSALASDIMWREVVLTSKEKPIIASMSDVAASGGYYMAMACDTIVAHPNTITGSIGIFGLLFGAENFLENKIGITFDEVKTGKYAGIYMPTRESSPAEDSLIQQSVNEGYVNFTTKAAQGRNMPREELLKYAEGRVWTGVDAKERGLVDVLGGLETAIEIAAKKADLGEDYQVRYYPEQKNFIEQLLDQTQARQEAKLKAELGAFYNYYKYYKELQTMQGIQARSFVDAQNIR